MRKYVILDLGLGLCFLLMISIVNMVISFFTEACTVLSLLKLGLMSFQVYLYLSNTSI